MSFLGIHPLKSGKTGVQRDRWGRPVSPRSLPGAFWGITTFYNPARYATKLANYRKFRDSLKRQGLKLCAVELAFEDAPFELVGDDAEILIQLRGGRENILWQKEALLNIALNRLPQDCDKIVWIDCDVIFKNDGWIAETVALLQTYAVVQPYAHVARMPKEFESAADPEGFPDGLKIGEKWHGIAYGVSRAGRGALAGYVAHGCSGYAWAARRDVFGGCGFFDKMILGSADLLMAYAFYGHDDRSLQGGVLPDGLVKERAAWAKIVGERVSGSVVYTPGIVLHLWHGDIGARLYEARSQILRQQDFDPATDIEKDGSGLWRWASVKPALHQAVEDYFYYRNEDGCPQGQIQEDAGRQKIFQTLRDAQSSCAVAEQDKTFFVDVERRYLDFLARVGEFLRGHCPGLYMRIKEFFPDRLPGERLPRPYFTSVSVGGLCVVVVAGVFCALLFRRSFGWRIMSTVFILGGLIALFMKMKGRRSG